VSDSASPRATAVSWAKKGVKLALLAPAAWGRVREPGLFVLIYHRVGAGQGREMDLPARTFAAQMRDLRGRFEVVSLHGGFERIERGTPPRDLVAVTFDDGYREMATTAWPILRDLAIPAAAFLPTGFIQGNSPAPLRAGAGRRGAPPEPLTWDQVGEMAASGLLTIGSHSVTHRDFDRLSPAEAEDEAGASKALIESKTGAEVDVFAYPRAVVAHEEVVAAHYRYAVAADSVKNVARSFDPLRVTRTPVRGSDGIMFFRSRLSGIRPLEDDLYAWLRKTLR